MGPLEDLALEKNIFGCKELNQFWIKKGGSKTRFSYRIVNGRRKRNLIERLEVGSGWGELEAPAGRFFFFGTILLLVLAK